MNYNILGSASSLVETITSTSTNTISELTTTTISGPATTTTSTIAETVSVSYDKNTTPLDAYIIATMTRRKLILW